MASAVSTLPAQLAVSAREDLRLDFLFVDDAGASIDITGSDYGTFALTFTPVRGTGADIVFPSGALELAKVGAGQNILRLAATKAALDAAGMTADKPYKGELIHTLDGVTETYGVFHLRRSTAPQTVSEIGTWSITLTKRVDGIVTIRTAKGQKGDTSDLAALTYQPAVAPAAVAMPLYLASVEFATPEQHTSGCGDDATDATAALVALAAHTGKVVLPRGGIYRVSDPLVIDNILNRAPWWEAQNGAFIRSALTAGEAAFTLGASTRQGTGTRTLIADAGETAESFRVDSVAGLARGSVMRLVSEAIYDKRTSSKLGEFTIVDSVDAGTGTVYPAWPLQDTYLVSNSARCYDISMLDHAHIDGLRLIGDEGTVGSPLYSDGFVAQYCMNFSFNDFDIRGFSTRAMLYWDCLNGRVIKPTTEITIPNSQLGYNQSVQGPTQGLVIEGHSSKGGRHAYTTNNTNSGNRYGITGANIYRDAHIYSTQSAGDALDTHAACRFQKFENINLYNSIEFGVNIECRAAEIDGLYCRKSAAASIMATNYTERDGYFSFRDLDLTAAVGNALQIAQHPLISTGVYAAGKVERASVHGFKARGYTGKAIYFKNLGLLSQETAIDLDGIDIDAASSTDLNGQIYIEPARHLIVKPLDLRNVPYNGIGLRTVNLAILSGRDLGTVHFRDGPAAQKPSGTAFYFDANTAVVMTGRTRGSVAARASNTAKCFFTHANITGLALEYADGDAATSGLGAGADAAAVYEGLTIAADEITITRSLQLHFVQVGTEGAAATDDLKKINVPGGLVRGKTIYLIQSSGSQTVTVKDNVAGGNIRLRSGRDYILGASAPLMLEWDGFTNWQEPARTTVPNVVTAVAVTGTLAAPTQPRTAVEVTTGATQVDLTLPTGAETNDEILITKVDSGAAKVSVIWSASEVVALTLINHAAVLRWTGSTWRLALKATA